MKRKQNSAEKVKRKLTVWQYQYDNGEAGMLHEVCGGAKREYGRTLHISRTRMRRRNM